MLEYNNKALTYGNRWLEEDLSVTVDPGTFRFAFSDPYFDPLKYGKTVYNAGANPWVNGVCRGTQVRWERVSGKPNVWDCHLTNPDRNGTWNRFWQEAIGNSYSGTPFVCDVALVAANFNWADSGILYQDQSTSKMFDHCESLVSVSNLIFASDPRNNGAYVADDTFLGCPNIETINLPNLANAGGQLSGLFSNVGLKHVRFGDMSGVVSVSGMFSNYEGTTEWPDRGRNTIQSVVMKGTQNITRWDKLFAGCGSLTDVYIESTASAINMEAMFQGCTSLRKAPAMDTSNVTNMSYMFCGCSHLQELPQLDTSSVTNAERMCDYCSEARGVPELYEQMSSQATPPANHFLCFRFCGTNAWRHTIDHSWGGLLNSNKWTFELSAGTVELTGGLAGDYRQPYSQHEYYGPNTSYKLGMEFDADNPNKFYVYADDYAVLQISGSADARYALTAADINIPLTTASGLFTKYAYYNPDNGSLTSAITFDTTGVTKFNNMFRGNFALTSVPLYNTSSATSTAGMFNECSSLTSVPLYDTSAVTDMSYMFRGCSSLTSVPLYDTSAVTDMSYMFRASGVQSVPAFDTSHVTNMTQMFASSSIPAIPSLDLSHVGTLTRMYYDCASIATIPLLTSIKRGAVVTGMFEECVNVESGALDLYNYLNNGAVVSQHSNMFKNCGVDTVSGSAELAQIPSSWGGTAV